MTKCYTNIQTPTAVHGNERQGTAGGWIRLVQNAWNENCFRAQGLRGVGISTQHNKIYQSWNPSLNDNRREKNGQASLGWRLWKIRPLLDLGNQFCVDQKPDTPRFYHQFSSGLKPQIAQMSKGVGAHTGFLSSSFFSFYTVTEGAQGPGGSTLEDVPDTGVQSPGWGSTGQLDKGVGSSSTPQPGGPLRSSPPLGSTQESCSLLFSQALPEQYNYFTVLWSVKISLQGC